MKINKVKGIGCHYMTDINTVLSNTSNQGIMDSLGRTAVAALVYDEDRGDLIKGLESYFKSAFTSHVSDSQVYVKRYPVGGDYAIVGNSRDHVIYALTTMKLLGEDVFVKYFVKYRSKRPSIELAYTINQKVWFKALYSRFWSNIYMSMEVPYLRLIQGLKWVVRKFKGNGDKLLPTFAVFYSIWGAQALAGNWAKRRIFKAALPHFEDTNYAARMICGEYVPGEIVKSYIPTRKNRWTTRLDKEGDRDMREYPQDTPENNVELGLLHYLYKWQMKDK